MGKKENLTITLDGVMLDAIRKIADKNFRSINKQVVYWLSMAIQDEKFLQNGSMPQYLNGKKEENKNGK
jgi:hypothetical protein